MNSTERRGPVKRLDKVREELRVWGVGGLAVLGIAVGGTVIRVWHWITGRPKAQEMAESWRRLTIARVDDDQMTKRRKRPVSSVRKALDRYGR